MNEQINLRLPAQLLKQARQKAKTRGFSTIQSYIEQTIREDLYDDYKLSKKELALIDRVVKTTENKDLWISKEEFYKKLQKNSENSVKNPRKSS